jgi:hypothetical protein
MTDLLLDINVDEYETHLQEKKVEDKSVVAVKSVEEKEKSQQEKDFHKKAVSQTKLILEELSKTGFSEVQKIVNKDGKMVWPTEIFNFVLRNLKQRARTDLRSVQQARNELSHAERVSNLLYGNVTQEGTSKRIKYDNFVTLEETQYSSDSKPTKKIEIHYGALETKADKAFSEKLLVDLLGFLEDETEVKINRNQNLEVKVVFHYPKGESINQEILAHLQLKMIQSFKQSQADTHSNEAKLLFSVETQNLPFRAETIKNLDKKIDIGKHHVGRHPLEKYRDVELAEVKDVIDKIINGLPESSNLRGLMESNRKVFISELSKKVTQYKGGDLKDTSGYIFEIATILELSQESTLWSQICEATNSKTEGPYKLRITNPEMESVNTAYSQQMSKTARSHGEFLIIKNFASNPADDDNRVVAIVECKTSSQEKIIDEIKDQLKSQKDEIPYFVRYYNKWKKGKKLSTLPDHLINSIVIKPRFDRGPNDGITPIKILPSEKGMVSVIRSDLVTDIDMDIVKGPISEHYLAKKQTEEVAAIVNDPEL